MALMSRHEPPLVKKRAQRAGKKVALMLTGGNIDLELFNTWIANARAGLPA
jgi:threonine dehydratase